MATLKNRGTDFDWTKPVLPSLACAIFLCDLFLNTEIACFYFYPLVIAVSYCSRNKKLPVTYALLSSGFIIAAGSMSPVHGWATPNRLAMIAIVWFICFILKRQPFYFQKHNTSSTIKNPSNQIVKQGHIDYESSLHDLVFELTNVEIHERQRLASLLHDGIGQNLMLAKLNIEALTCSPQRENSEKLLANISNVLNDAIDEVKALTYDMRIAELDQIDLKTALDQFLKEKLCDYQKISFKISDNGLPIPLEKGMLNLLYQSVQELILNCIKHANASEIKVNIVRETDDVKITVEDNGQGFDVKNYKLIPTTEGGFGLYSIQQRLTYAHGQLDIQSDQQHGTKVTLIAPLDVV